MQKLRVGRLHNGVSVVTMEDRGTHIAGVLVGSGSTSNPEGVPDLAHIVEHVLCYRSEKLGHPEFELLLESLGCGPREDIRIETTDGGILFATNILTRRRHALDLFPHFASMVKPGTVDPRILQIELAAALNEHEYHVRDSAEALVEMWLHRTMYEKNPIRGHYNCVGVRDGMLITPEAVEGYIRTNFVAGNIVAIILGPSHKDAMACARRRLGDFATVAAPTRPITDEVWPVNLNGIKSAEIERSVFMSYPGDARRELHKIWHFGFAFPTWPFGHEDDEAIAVLASILRFRAEMILRDENLVLGEGTYHPIESVVSSRVHGMLYLWFHSLSGDFLRKGEERLLREIRIIQNGGVSDDEVEAALLGVAERKVSFQRVRVKAKYRKILDAQIRAMRDKHRWAYVSAYEQGTSRLVDFIVEAVTSGSGDVEENINVLNGFLRRLRRVGRRRVIRAAGKYLTPDKYVRVVIKPAEEDLVRDSKNLT